MPLARMGVRGTGPIQLRVLEARIHDLVFPFLSRDRAPYSPVDLLTLTVPAAELLRRSRSPIGSASRHQCPDDARHLVSEGDDHQHGRLEGKHARKPRIRCRAFAHCPAHGRARADDQ